METQSRVHLSVVIPAYNEELRLPNTLSQSIEYLKLQPYSSEIIVVNDGSSDETEKVVRGYFSSPVSVKLLAHSDGANHGKGASVRLGMLKAGGAWRLFMDADNSVSVDQIDRFWPLFSQGHEVVIGSRALRGSVIDLRQTRRKELAGRLGNWIIRMCAVPGILDTQVGFKVFSGDKTEMIFSRQTIERWGFDVELLVIARCHGCRIGEVPVTWANVLGSKVTIGSYLEVLKDVWRIRRNLKAGLYK
jgi:dolichyl-phosphate beta-glucosyltransferase